ncbi:MAG: hypothetical protein HY897_18955 [Deltaproteobacteria bacterium]|nr:hypothetical protein [Deltaproteobacteria bacterium]
MEKKTRLIVGSVALAGVIVVVVLLRVSHQTASLPTLEDKRVEEMTRAGAGEAPAADETFDDRFIDERTQIKRPDATAYLDNEIKKAKDSLDVCRKDKVKYKGCLNRLERLKALKEKMGR